MAGSRGVEKDQRYPHFPTSLLPYLSAPLFILAFPNFNLSSLAWIALVPLSLYARRASPRQAFGSGWLSGTLAYAGILSWIVITFNAAHLSTPLAFFSLLLLAGYLGLYWGAWASFASYCFFCPEQKKQCGDSFALGKRRIVAPLFGAAAWVALEYLRTYLFSGFPWALLADSQVKNLPLIQIASITGVYGVSFLIVMVNIAICQWDWEPVALAMGLLLGTVTFGYHQLNLPPPKAASFLKVALLQGNIDQYKKWDKAYVEDIQKTYEQLVLEASASKPDLILWPETSVPGYLLQDPPLRLWLEKVVRNSHTRHILGAPVMHENKAYNSAFSINSEGSLEGEYAKQHLVPFGEVVPWGSFLGRFINVLNDLGGFTAGKNSPVLIVAGQPVGVNICYEAIFPNLVRQSVNQGAVLIANLTNDGWYMKTAAPYQHWAPNVFRAVENGRVVLRADNTGVSGIIDPQGRVMAESPIYQTRVVTGLVYPRDVKTLYTRWGDLFAGLCCGIVILALYLRR